ncbi:MAG: hypothetical protein JSS81_26045 [Acidobacteria bacterium]|nr:hypothetical protein [Acidobacteriota bacterium]
MSDFGLPGIGADLPSTTLKAGLWLMDRSVGEVSGKSVFGGGFSGKTFFPGRPRWPELFGTVIERNGESFVNGVFRLNLIRQPGEQPVFIHQKHQKH